MTLDEQKKRLELVWALTAGDAEERDYLLQKLERLFFSWECLDCGGLTAKANYARCPTCEAAPKCERCKGVCERERFAEGEPRLCDSCSDEDFEQRKAGAPDDWWERRDAEMCAVDPARPAGGAA